MILSSQAQAILLLTSSFGDASPVSVGRVMKLLRRGTALGVAFERWERAGLWIIARSERDYPLRLKARLQSQSPPILFGCGDRRLLGKSSVAIVGSRNASEE